MTEQGNNAPRRLSWQDVTAIGLILVGVLAAGAMVLACAGRWPW